MGRIVPSPATEAPGNFNTSALFNAQVRDLNAFSLGPPVFYGLQTLSQSFANNATVAVALDTEIVDSDGGHSVTTNTSRYTAQVPGLYLVLGIGTFVANTAGVRSVRVALNGTTVRGSQITQPPASTQWAGATWALVTLNGTTDYVELTVSQTSGSTLTSYFGTDLCPAMAVYWLSR